MTIPSEPPDFLTLPAELFNDMSDSLSEKEVYNLVVTNKKHLFEQMDRMPKVAKKYYTYVINQEIGALHKKGRLKRLLDIDSTKKVSRLTSWFFDRTIPRSQSEKELPQFLKGETAQKYLTHLDLSYLKKEEISAILKAQGKPFLRMTEITLHNSDITSEELKDLLTMCPNLKKLDLWNCKNLQNIDLGGLHLDSLEELGLCRTLTSTDTIKFLTISPNLKKAKFHKCKGVRGVLHSPLPKQDSIEELDFSGSHITEGVFKQFLMTCPNAKVINIRFCASLRHLTLLSPPTSDHVEELNLENTSLTTQDFQQLLKKFPNLKELNLKNCPDIYNIDFTGISLPRLEKLQIRNISITALDTRHFLEQCPKLADIDVFEKPFRKLTTLNPFTISGSVIGLITKKYPNIKTLVLSHLNNLTRLDLKDSNIEEIEITIPRLSAKQFMRIVEEPTKLKTLTLKQCTITGTLTSDELRHLNQARQKITMLTLTRVKFENPDVKKALEKI